MQTYKKLNLRYLFYLSDILVRQMFNKKNLLWKFCSYRYILAASSLHDDRHLRKKVIGAIFSSGLLDIMIYTLWNFEARAVQVYCMD